VSFARLKNLEVIAIAEEIPQDLEPDELLVDMSGLDPVPEIGWRLVGPDLLPPGISLRPSNVSLSDHIQSSMTDHLISERRMWAEDLIERMKKMNIEYGLGIAQSLWVHERLRKLTITVGEAHAAAFPPLEPVVGMTFNIDLLNLVITGDVETAFAVLLCAEPDDMTQPYHALSQEMIGWIMNEISSYLGWS